MTLRHSAAGCTQGAVLARAPLRTALLVCIPWQRKILADWPCLGLAAGGSRTHAAATHPRPLRSPTDVAAFNLPPSLRGLVVPPDAFEYERLPGGELVVLGEGARWAAGAGMQ